VYQFNSLKGRRLEQRKEIARRKAKSLVGVPIGITLISASAIVTPPLFSESFALKFIPTPIH